MVIIKDMRSSTVTMSSSSLSMHRISFVTTPLLDQIWRKYIIDCAQVIPYFVEGVGDDVVVLTHQVGDCLQQLHQVQLFLVPPTLVLGVIAGQGVSEEASM